MLGVTGESRPPTVVGGAVASDDGEPDVVPGVSVDELRRELSDRLFVRALIAGGVQDLVRYGTVCVVAYFGYRSIAALAGQTTLANIGIRFLSNVSVSAVASWAVGMSGLAYGVWQRRLRFRTRIRRASHDWFANLDRGRE